MARIVTNLSKKKHIILEQGEFHAEFISSNSEADIELRFYSGHDEKTSTIYPIKPEQIDDLYDLVSHLRMELRKRKIATNEKELSNVA